MCVVIYLFNANNQFCDKFASSSKIRHFENSSFMIATLSLDII